MATIAKRPGKKYASIPACRPARKYQRLCDRFDVNVRGLKTTCVIASSRDFDTPSSFAVPSVWNGNST